MNTILFLCLLVALTLIETKTMGKLKGGSISGKDIADFVANDSDFAFEMKVLGILRQHGLECLHSGTYQDPVSDKIRQFDIRARGQRGRVHA